MNQLSIGEVSKRIGLTTKTIRFYESIGLLSEPKRASNGYRYYLKDDLETLELIKKIKDMGVSLSEIRKIVKVCNSRGCIHANKYIKDNLPFYISSIDQKIKELQLLKTQLNSLNINLSNVSKTTENVPCCDLAKGGENNEVGTMLLK